MIITILDFLLLLTPETLRREPKVGSAYKH